MQVIMKPNVKSQSAKEAPINVFADTGASLCVAGLFLLKLLGIKLNHLKPTSKRISTATGGRINCRGWFPTQITLNGRKTIENIYVCSNIERVYLSKNGCINLGIVHKGFPNPLESIDSLTLDTSIPDPSKDLPKLPFAPTPENIPLLKDYLLKTFSKTAFNNDKSRVFPKMTGVPKAHIHLPQNAKPYCRTTPNQIPHYWTDGVKNLLDEFKNRGMIEKTPIGVATPWCSPMVITPKKSNSPEPKLRMTIDFQHLNSQCLRELHHVESPFRLASQIPKGTYKTILDAVDGYQAIELDDESKLLTNFITNWGCFHFLRLPAGLIDSGDKYTSRYDSVIKDVPRKVKCVDDTLLFDYTIEEAFRHTYDYLSLCASRGITINASKFEFCKKDITFAGFQITPTGIKPAESTLKAIRDFPVPDSVTDVRSWFGLVRQVAYAHSVSDQLAPFRELLQHKDGQKPKFIWNERLQKVFDESKQHILTSVVNGIEMFDPSLHTCLQCDWSKQGIGFLLLQKHCKCTEPPEETMKQCCKDGWKLTYAGSRFTNEAEGRYAPTEGEALAVAWALKTSRLFTLGCPRLTVVTDHKPLLGIFNDRDLGSIKNPRIRRIKEHTLEYHFSIKYCPGKLHLGADALSRYPVSHITDLPTTTSCEEHMEATVYHAINSISDDQNPHTAITLEKVELECIKDPNYVDLHNLVLAGFPETRAQVPSHCKSYCPLADKGSLSTFRNIVLYNERLIIPKALQSQVIRILHSAHQGCTGMLARAGTSVYWPGIRKSIMSYQSNCRTCSQISPSQAREPMKLTPLPERPFQNICSDIFQMKNNYYLIVVDRFSGFIHIFRSKEAPTHQFLIKHLRDIFKRYGRPEQFDSDGGPQFRAHAFTRFLETWGTKHRISSPYYAQANGRAEAAVKSAKRMLQENTGENGTLDNDAVACAVLQYHNTPLQDGQMSPAQLLFGRALADFLPVNPKAYNLHPYWSKEVKAAQKRRKSHSNKLARRYNFGTRRLQPLVVSQSVLVQDQVHGTKRWNRSGVVVKCLPHRQYKVRLYDTGNTTVRNRRFLKPANTIPQHTRPYSRPVPGPNLPTNDISNHEDPPAAAVDEWNVQQPHQVLTRPTTTTTPPPMQTSSTPHAIGKEQMMLRRLRPFNRPGLKE